MKITANIATYPPRIESLKRVVASLYDQVDLIRVYFNEMEYSDIPLFFKDLQKVVCNGDDGNLTDNGKFYQLDHLDKMSFDVEESISPESEYFLTCDDDIIYPADYVEKTIENLKKHGTIITYHGRQLGGTSRNYYDGKGHKAFKHTGRVEEDTIIDVAGTGCSAFSTEYFHPKGLADHELKRMSDLIFSLEAAKQGKVITCCEHDYGWLKHIDNDENIFDTESKGHTRDQNRLADEIYLLRHGA